MMRLVTGIRCIKGLRGLSLCAVWLTLLFSLQGCGSKPHIVEISSDPSGAIIFLNNRMIGETPLETTIQQRKGTYNIYVFRALKEQYKVGRKAYKEQYYDDRVADVVPKSIHFSLLKRQKLRIGITSDPAGAVVTLNGEVVGETPCTAVVFERIGPPRTFRFTLVKEGFAPLEEVIHEAGTVDKAHLCELPDRLHFDLKKRMVSTIGREK